MYSTVISVDWKDTDISLSIHESKPINVQSIVSTCSAISSTAPKSATCENQRNTRPLATNPIVANAGKGLKTTCQNNSMFKWTTAVPSGNTWFQLDNEMASVYAIRCCSFLKSLGIGRIASHDTHSLSGHHRRGCGFPRKTNHSHIVKLRGFQWLLRSERLRLYPLAWEEWLAAIE